MKVEDTFCPLATQTDAEDPSRKPFAQPCSGLCAARSARRADRENSISEPVLGDLTEITLVAQASDREHVPSCRQTLTSTDASYTGKDLAWGGAWPPEIRQMLHSRGGARGGFCCPRGGTRVSR
ncbi:uncharacterized protein [Vicugna pacos]|uniref:Uncharacterized protein n=2 Tax=Vicugna pacos TaxID=30538 RepID=A0ABM5CXQ1_VICPA